MNSLCFFMILTFPVLCLAQTNPGFQVKLTQNGLDLLGNYAHVLVRNYLSKKYYHNFDGTYGDEVKFELKRLEIAKFNRKDFTSRVAVEPGYGLTWTIGNLNLDLKSGYTAKFERFGGAGTVKIKVHKATIILLLTGEVADGGKLMPLLEDCQVYISMVRVDFAKTWTDRLLSILKEEIERMAKNLMQKHLCEKFRQELMPVFQNKLLQVDTSAQLFDAFHLNYSVVSDPMFDDQIIETNHNGAVYALLRQGEHLIANKDLPFEAPPLKVDADTDKMLYMYLSNHTVASLFYWMDQFKMFNYDFSRASVSKDMRDYFKTECGGEEICAGSLFPSLRKKYPNSLVEVYVTTIQYPKVNIQDGFINVSTSSKIDGFIASIDNSKRETFLTAKIDFYSRIKKFKLNNYVMTGELEFDNFVLYEINSSVKEIDANSIDFLVSGIIDLVVREDLATKLRDGIFLPKILGFRMVNGKIVMKPDVIVLSSDFCTSSSDCKSKAAATTEAPESSEDYYDYYA